MIDVIRMLRRLAVVGLLLAPLPAAAEDGFVADPRNGCKAWITGIKPDSTIRWVGGCDAGYATGRGTLEFIIGSKFQSRIEGEFRNGKRAGRALTVRADGSRFEGEYRDGVAAGRGISIKADGTRCEGEYRDDEVNGYGVCIAPNGSGYEGEWKDNKPDGQGTYRGPANDGTTRVWSGQWHAGCYNTNGRRAAVATTNAACGFD